MKFIWIIGTKGTYIINAEDIIGISVLKNDKNNTAKLIIYRKIGLDVYLSDLLKLFDNDKLVELAGFICNFIASDKKRYVIKVEGVK